MDKLDQYRRLIEALEKQAVTTGLTADDAVRLRACMKEVDSLRRAAVKRYKEYKRLNKITMNTVNSLTKSEYLEHSKLLLLNIQYINSVEDRFKSLHERLKRMMPYTSLVAFIFDNCSLLDLALANTPEDQKIKLYDLDGYLFCCHNHTENEPSMGFSNSKRLGSCFSCKWRFDIISYVMDKEGLSKSDAIDLIAKVFMIDIENNSFKEDDELVTKYRDPISSIRYRELLQMGAERTERAEDCFNKTYALEIFHRDLEHIDRIAECRPLQYSHEEIPADKRFILTEIK